MGLRNDGPYRGKRLFDLAVLLLVAMPAASVSIRGGGGAELRVEGCSSVRSTLAWTAARFRV